MDASLNIVELIENNPIVKLSQDYNNRFICKIKENFTETQQQLFVSSFYCYLNYNQITDFVIDLDNIWVWLGFSQKVKAKALLENNFIIDKDYKLLSHMGKQTNDTRGGHNKQKFMLNIRTFKLFCIKAGTSKANEIHEYFVKLEDIMHQVVQEECIELKQKLENQITSTQLEKELLREKTIIEQFSVNTQCVYYGIIDDKTENNERLIKYGNSNNLKERVERHKKTYTNFRLVNAFKVENKLHIENAIKNCDDLKSYKRVIDIKDVKYTELLAIGELSFEKLDKIIKNIITNIEYSPENYMKLLDKIQKLEKIKDEYENFKKTIFKKVMEENNRLKMEYDQLIKNEHSEPSRKKLRKFQKHSDGFYYINGDKYSKLTGTRQEVWDGVAYRTVGELTKADFIMNKCGEIVSKVKSVQSSIDLRPICMPHK